MSAVNIDLSYLKTIGGNDNEFIKEMLLMFLNSAPAEVVGIEQFYHNGQFPQMGSAAHKIKAPVQMIGEQVLADLVIRIEMIGKTGQNTDEAPGLIKQLKEHMAQVVPVVEALVKTL